MSKSPNIETVLRQHPVKAPVRASLATDTLRLALQARRVHRVRQLSGWLFIVIAASLALKWLSNDLGYLLQLPITQLQAVQGQANIYIEALWESLPKLPLIATVAAGLLWFGWRYFETLLVARRITGVKQGPIMKAIKLTPRLTAASAALGIVALGLSGYAVAQKIDQHKLEILRQFVNASGRSQLDTNAISGECNHNGAYTSLTGQYEIKRGATISRADAVHVIEALCAEAEADRFLRQAFNLPPGVHTDGPQLLLVYRVISRFDGQIKVELPISGDDSQRKENLIVTSSTKVFKGSAEASLDDLKPGDIIKPLFPHGGGAVMALVILPTQPEFKWYNIDLKAQLTPIQTCEGNPKDICSFTGNVKFYPSGQGEETPLNRAYLNGNNFPTKSITGVITEIKPAYTKIKTSSGRIFRINFGSNPADDFNRKLGSHLDYGDKDPVTIGDTLSVQYTEPADKHATTIPQDHIVIATLVVESASTQDPYKKY